MKRYRSNFAVLALFLGLLLCGGCSAFRAAFDEDPAVTRQKHEEAKKRREARKRSDTEIDPFAALFRKKEKKPETRNIESSLNAKERAILRQTEAESKGVDSNAEVERIHRENRERSDKLSESVFGGGVKDWF